jgi:hypothetical protein
VLLKQHALSVGRECLVVSAPNELHPLVSWVIGPDSLTVLDVLGTDCLLDLCDVLLG